MKILKFGGSSVANATNIKKVIQIIFASATDHEKIIVVVSALGGMTDNLITLAKLAATRAGNYQALLRNICKQHNQAIKQLINLTHQKPVLAEIKRKYHELDEVVRGIALLQELSLRSLDQVMSFGEQLSAYIISEAIKSQGRAGRFVDARALIKTDDNFGSANVAMQTTYDLIADCFKTAPPLSIMGGFIASSHDGITTTLGRGGSDYTASLVGAAVQAAVIEIWTDVDGVMTADPRTVPQAFPVATISYEEAGELAHFGAKVIHPKTMKPARLRDIPIQIKNTFNPLRQGTIISNAKTQQPFPITGISSLGNVSLLRIQSNSSKSIGAIAAKLFDSLAHSAIEVLLITQASHEQSISIAVSQAQATAAKAVLEKDFALELKAKQMLTILIENNLSIVAIVGKQMKGVPGISGKLFSTLGNNNINVVAIAQGSSELNISAVIYSHDETKALQVIHDTFFAAQRSDIHLFVVGTGLIGSTLLNQLKASQPAIQLCGLANSRTMLVAEHGIALRNWKQQLARSRPAVLPDFINQMIACNLPNSVLVDCTASAAVVAEYEHIFSAGIAIVTPNKQANSGSLAHYQTLKNLAKKNHVPFIYETNVGAGLPIIHTIRNLVASGDIILKIEAVLSGTLSYIFNTFAASSQSFSQIVRAAQQKGYTEPDPRDDLTGLDVGRKMLILAREIGLKLELKHIKIVPLVPPSCFQVSSIDKFFAQLEKNNSHFAKQKRDAQKHHQVLRYIATLQAGQASVALRAVDQSHPFYHLSGSDNIISITTKRYHRTPLVIKGSGAGAAVTAGGVLANISSILK